MDEITIEQLIHFTGDYFNFKGTYENAPTYPGSVARRCPDITKARTQLGYEPKVGWQEGLTKTLAWYADFFQSGKKTFETAFEKPKL